MKYLIIILLPLIILTGDDLDIRVQERNPSHKIINPIILKPIKRAIEREISKKNSILDVIILRIDSISDTHQNVYTLASNFQTELIFHKQSKKANNPKGYLWVDNVLVLLYNEPGSFFKKIGIPNDIFEIDIDNNTFFPISIHTSYYYYKYEKFSVFDEINESMELSGQMDEIED
jgi:hypothetical protein